MILHLVRGVLPARGLPAPGPRAYFSPTGKVGKSVPKPTVLDSLDGEARSRLFPIRGCLIGLGVGGGISATELEAEIFGLVGNRLRLTPC